MSEIDRHKETNLFPWAPSPRPDRASGQQAEARRPDDIEIAVSEITEIIGRQAGDGTATINLVLEGDTWRIDETQESGQDFAGPGDQHPHAKFVEPLALDYEPAMYDVAKIREFLADNRDLLDEIAHAMRDMGSQSHYREYADIAPEEDALARAARDEASRALEEKLASWGNEYERFRDDRWRVVMATDWLLSDSGSAETIDWDVVTGKTPEQHVAEARAQDIVILGGAAEITGVYTGFGMPDEFENRIYESEAEVSKAMGFDSPEEARAWGMQIDRFVSESPAEEVGLAR